MVPEVFSPATIAIFYCVSILVVLEVVPEVLTALTFSSTNFCFNPCCSGSGSGRERLRALFCRASVVSILVVLEVVPEVYDIFWDESLPYVSILVVLEVVPEESGSLVPILRL